MTQLTALIVAGGTGGHIFPGLSVAHALKGQGWAVRWAGNPDAMEGQLVPKHDIELLPLVFAGFRGKGILDKLLMPIRLLRAFAFALTILRRHKPDVVLGMGGYVAFPLGMMSALLNVPLVIHEQNSVAGLTNRVLAKVADRVLLAFPDALKSGQWVGNPVRHEMVEQPSPQVRYAGRTGPLHLLVVGGSLGAVALNEVVPQALALLEENQRPQVCHQAGQKKLESLKAHYENAGVQAQCVPFLDDMARAMADADILICRAGAMTVSEVAAVGVPALFIPFPYAVDDHQTTNAQFLVEAQGGWLKQQHDLTPEWLAAWLGGLTREACLVRAQQASARAKREATSEVVEVMNELVKQS